MVHTGNDFNMFIKDSQRSILASTINNDDSLLLFKMLQQCCYQLSKSMRICSEQDAVRDRLGSFLAQCTADQLTSADF